MSRRETQEASVTRDNTGDRCKNCRRTFSVSLDWGWCEKCKDEAREARATKLAEATADAYMADSYGATDWRACSLELLSRGLTVEEAEAILRSKHMRWADDGAVSDRPSIEGFRHYLASPHMKDADLKALARGMGAGR